MDLNLQLVETDWLHVWLDSFRTWPDGITFFLHLRKPDGDGPSLEIRMEDGKVVWPNFWLGVTFADGRADQDRMSDISMAPVSDEAWLRSLGCGGTAERLDEEVLLTPVPPPGRLTWTFSWPDGGIDNLTRSIDAAVLIDAPTNGR